MLQGEALQEQIDLLCLKEGDGISSANVVVALEAIGWKADLADVKACAPFKTRRQIVEASATPAGRAGASTSSTTGADTGASKGPRLLDLADMEEEARKETGGPVLTIPGNDQIVDEEQIQDVYMAMTKEVRSLAAKVCAEYGSDKIGDLEKILSDALLAADIKTFNVDLKSVDQSQEQVQVTGRASLPWRTRPCHLIFLPLPPELPSSNAGRIWWSPVSRCSPGRTRQGSPSRTQRDRSCPCPTWARPCGPWSSSALHWRQRKTYSWSSRARTTGSSLST
jgi:hypothetical protein